MTDEMLVEAVARALDPELWDYAGPDDWNGARERARHRASRALSALPPEMRAAGEMKRALAGMMKIAEHRWRALPADSPEKKWLANARAALALASSPGQKSTKDGEEG